MEKRCRSGTVTYVLFLALGAVVAKATAEGTTATCDPYNYCDGESLDAATIISGRTVFCDVVKDPKEQCCLPQARHVVCYDIIVDGQFLNYDPSGRSSSTDLTELCETIAEQRGKSAGKYSAMVTSGGGGYLAYRRGVWLDVEAHSHHIKHLACEIV